MDQMNATEEIANNSGWLKECVGEKPDVGSSDPIIPQTIQSASAWQSVVTEEQKQILTERKKILQLLLISFCLQIINQLWLK
jgi:hypothetical protein